MPTRLIDLALFQQGVTEIRVSRGVIWLQLERGSVMRNRLLADVAFL